MSVQDYEYHDKPWDIERKMLQNQAYALASLVNGQAIKANVVPSSTTQWTTYADVTVSTPGVKVQFSDIPCENGFRFSAARTNTQDFYLGDQYMDTTASRHGTIIKPNESLVINTITNLNQVWFDADNNSDVLYIQRL